MQRPLPTPSRQWLRDVPFLVFLATVPLALLRAIDVPSVEVGALDVTIADVFLAATAVLAVVRLLEERRLPSPVLLGAAAAFAGYLFVSAFANGTDAITSAAKIGGYGALTLGAAAFLVDGERVRAFFAVVVAWTTAAAAWALVGFLTSDRGRQGSFMGEHDMAALATLAAAVGLARLHARRGSPGPVAIAGLAAGLVGAVLAASLASVIGIYLVCAVVLALSWRRGDLRPASAGITLGLAVVATAGTLALRQGELGFLQEWFGTPSDTPGETAASWSHRLIYTYIGGRIFLDHPVLGTGWHGLLPPEEFAQYVPDARERFPDQPFHYFPPTDAGFIPQQTYDQILFELGVVGAGLFVLLAVLAVARAAKAARRRPGERGYVPAAWLGALAGALAGAALFGGSPLTAMLWLTLGLVAVESEPA